MALMDRNDRRNKKPATKIIKKPTAQPKTSVPAVQVNVGAVQTFDPDWTSVSELELLVAKYDETVVVLRRPLTSMLLTADGAYHGKRKPKPAKTLKGVIARLASYGLTQDDFAIISGPPAITVRLDTVPSAGSTVLIGTTGSNRRN